jgi:hypothetical protein
MNQYSYIYVTCVFPNSKGGAEYGLGKLHMLNAVIIPVAVEESGINIHVSLHIPWILIRAPITERAFQRKLFLTYIISNLSWIIFHFLTILWIFFFGFEVKMFFLVVTTQNCIQTKIRSMEITFSQAFRLNRRFYYYPSLPWRDQRGV